MPELTLERFSKKVPSQFHTGSSHNGFEGGVSGLGGSKRPKNDDDGVINEYCCCKLASYADIEDEDPVDIEDPVDMPELL